MQIIKRCFQNTFTEVGCFCREFRCDEIVIKTDSDYMESIKALAIQLTERVNRGQANTSDRRDAKTVYADNLLGLLAENVCYCYLRYKFGEYNIIKPPAESSVGQIDIKLSNGKSIEVRSSCIKNGIEFALFKMDTHNAGMQYIDIIGPYNNAYKPYESLKDYYMRVIYAFDKKEFNRILTNPELSLFITGGADCAMMSDPNVYQTKHLLPATGEVVVESDYRVIPIGRSLDIEDFIKAISAQNAFCILNE